MSLSDVSNKKSIDFFGTQDSQMEELFGSTVKEDKKKTRRVKTIQDYSFQTVQVKYFIYIIFY